MVQILLLLLVKECDRLNDGERYFIKSPESMDEATSLALVRDGKICGWMLTFWQNENALVFNCFFVREEL